MSLAMSLPLTATTNHWSRSTLRIWLTLWQGCKGCYSDCKTIIWPHAHQSWQKKRCFNRQTKITPSCTCWLRWSPSSPCWLTAVGQSMTTYNPLLRYCTSRPSGLLYPRGSGICTQKQDRTGTNAMNKHSQQNYNYHSHHSSLARLLQFLITRPSSYPPLSSNKLATDLTLSELLVEVSTDVCETTCSPTWLITR